MTGCINSSFFETILDAQFQLEDSGTSGRSRGRSGRLERRNPSVTKEHCSTAAVPVRASTLGPWGLSANPLHQKQPEYERESEAKCPRSWPDHKNCLNVSTIYHRYGKYG